MPKLSVTVSQELNAIITQKAAEKGQPKTEWVEQQIIATLSGTPGADQRVIDAVMIRCEQLETRMFHENSVVLHLLFETFREAAHASTAGMSSASSMPPENDAEADERRHFLFKEAETEFHRRREDLIAQLKDMRDDAKAKSKAPAIPANGSATADKGPH